MPPIKDTGPPVPGTLRKCKRLLYISFILSRIVCKYTWISNIVCWAGVVVIKANNLRANGAGRLSSPMVRLR